MEGVYSKLRDESISEDDYAHPQKVWENFGCRTLGDYHGLYLRSDVPLLADVFEGFCKICLKQYGLDPAHCYGNPGLSWEALSKKTGVLTDYGQHLFTEKGMCSGISMVLKRFARVKNPHVEGYDPAKPPTHLLYLNANNLYG